ncbi:MAG: TetR/AcrR family transcriptional regulator [Microbacteriaceae bacterium]
MTTSPDATDPRSDLVRAALAELVDGGRSAVSLRAVARRAGVSHAAPGYHFRDRAGLLAAVAADGFRRLAASLDAAVPDDRDPLAELGERYIRFATAHPALYELMFRPEELDREAPELRDAQAASLRALIHATGPAGTPTTATVISWAFAHGVASLSIQGAISALPLGDARDLGALVDEFTHGIRAAG